MFVKTELEKLTNVYIISKFVNKNSMPKNLLAIRLHEARLMMGYSMEQLAAATSHAVTKQSVSRYEKGEMTPRSATLSLLASALHISEEYFYGTNIHIYTPMLRNAFKEMPSAEEIQRVEAQLAFWAEQYIEAEKAADMQIPFTPPVPSVVVSDAENACLAADALRQAWRCGDGPIPSVLRLMERKGIKILDRPLPGGVLGLSTWADGRYPLVVIDMANEKHTVERLRFTACHELGHLVLNIPQEIDMAEREKLCNKFAGYFLLPKSTLLEEIGNAARDKVTLDELIDIHDQYGVSVSALVHELWDFRIIPEEHYHWWYEEVISKNPKEVGWGRYLFPETLGREKRVRGNVE